MGVFHSRSASAFQIEASGNRSRRRPQTTTAAGCAADRVNKETYTVSKKKTYPSLVMAPPACKLPENRYADMCASYNYLEVITAPPKL